MSAISDIYNYFTPIEDAICAVFKAAGIVCISAAGEQPEDEAEAAGEQALQRPRPRVEVVLHPAADMGHLLPVAGRQAAHGHLPERAFRSTLAIAIITKDNILEHREFYAMVRYHLSIICHTVRTTAASETPRRLHYHNLQSLRVTGGNAGYRPQDGVIQTDLTADLDFSIQSYAFTALNS